MDVTGRLLRLAAERPHPLIVAAPGATAARLQVERECRERGWPLAGSPAEADLLVVCGSPGPTLTDIAGRVWEQMPSPRARAVAEREEDVGAVLHGGHRALADAGGQRAAAAARVTSHGSGHDPGADEDEQAGEGSGGGEGGEQGENGNDPGGSGGNEDHRGEGEHRAHGHGEHGEHGEMSMPGGLGMAARKSDRDGVALDVLHVPLGPLLPDWPAGLVVHAVLQGDVLQEASPRLVDAPAHGSVLPFWDEPWLRASSRASRRLRSP